MMNEPSIKGKIEQKYWKSKQKVIEKLGKDQDEFVIAGDAEVDARLEVRLVYIHNCSTFFEGSVFCKNKRNLYHIPMD